MKEIIIDGIKYNLVPVIEESDWEITCITPFNLPLAYLGHNGKSLPHKHNIHEISIGTGYDKKIFKIGNQTKYGKILTFILENNALKVEVGENVKLIDIEKFK